MSSLPENWARVALGELLTGIEAGSSFKCEERPPTPKEVGVVKVSAVTWGEYKELESKTCNDAQRIDSHLFIKPGDFLFSRANTIELVGACVIAGATQLRVMLSDKILRLSFVHELMKPWVLQFLRSKAGRVQIESLASGNQESMRNIGQERLRQIEIPLPPTSEQTRIVTKIEELLSDLDAGVAELKAAQKKLRQYRQSLLKAAVEGALTASWREAQRAANTPLETGAQLLERILRERRARWEEKQLAKFKEQGKTPPKDWQKKYPEPVAPDTTSLATLPEGWVWASVEQIGEVSTGFTPPTANANYFGGNIPFFKPTDLDAGYDVKDYRESLTELGAAQGRLLPAQSVLVTCIGATIGKTGLARVSCTTNQQINAVTASEDGVLPEYIYFVMASGFGQRQIKENASATTLPILNKSKFGALVIPVPCRCEQEVVIRRLEAEISRAEEQETAITRSLRQSTAQRQNILRAAFAGQLVPQDPNDEPASVLLDRICAERAAQAAVKKTRGRQVKEAA